MRTNWMSAGAGYTWRSAAGVLGLGAFLFTYGCASQPAAARAQAVEQSGAPVLVNCEPTQRTLVRQVVVNGAPVSQVECVTVAQPLPQQAAYGNVPAAQPAIIPASYGYTAPRTVTVPADDLEDAQIVRAPARYPAAQVRPARQVVYEQPRRTEAVNRGRSVKKSAIIIGSSAGVGAGVGAAVGGKKGALIGAAIGGGGAAIWDQVTRRK